MTSSKDRDIGGINIDYYTSAPLQMTKSAELPATPEEVFSTLADYTAMPEWFPGMSAVKVDNADTQTENGAGAVRVCSFGPEQSMTEDIVLFDAPEKLGYTIRDRNFMGMSNHFALVTVETKGGGSLLSWHQFFDHPDPEAFKAQGGAMLEGALENLRVKYLRD